MRAASASLGLRLPVDRWFEGVDLLQEIEMLGRQVGWWNVEFDGRFVWASGDRVEDGFGVPVGIVGVDP